MVINKYFDKIYVLNLSKRKDRLADMAKRLIYLNIDYQLYDAVDGYMLDDIYSSYKQSKINTYISNSSYLACALSHLSIYNNAKNNGYEKILILEDDILFHKNFNKKFDSLLLPDDFDLLYLSFIPITEDFAYWDYSLARNFVHNEKKEHNLIYANNLWSLMAYGISKKTYEKVLLDYKENFSYELDRYFVNKIQPMNNSYAITPQLIIGYDDYSDNTNRIENSIYVKSLDCSLGGNHGNYI